MVTQPPNVTPPEELERRSRELFENSLDRLDARTRSRLHQARNVALDELKKGSTRRYWVAVPLGGLAAAALVVFLMTSGHSPPEGEGATPLLDDFDIVADADSFEMIRDVEFYSWLAEQGAGESNSSG